LQISIIGCNLVKRGIICSDNVCASIRHPYSTIVSHAETVQDIKILVTSHDRAVFLISWNEYVILSSGFTRAASAL